MDKIIKIRKYLANTFEDKCNLADEILSFSVQIDICDFSNEKFTSYPFMVSFPGLAVRLKNDWKTQFEDCLSIKFICNLNVEFAIAEALKTNSSLQSINLERNKIGDEGSIAIAEALKTNSSLQ